MAINTDQMNKIQKVLDALKEYANKDGANNQRADLYEFLSNKLGIELTTNFTGTDGKSRIAYTDLSEVLYVLETAAKKM